MTNVNEIAVEQVKSAYSGKDGKCCCGCSGKHYHRTGYGDYRGGGTKNDIRQITRVLNVIKNAPVVEDEGGFVSAVIDGRLYIAYLEN
jgi:hypothetical protein